MQAAGDTARPETIDDALALLHASLDHLTSMDWRALGPVIQARALRDLGVAQAKLAVARGEALGAFDASGGTPATGASRPRRRGCGTGPSARQSMLVR